MARAGVEQYGTDSMFVSPDSLLLNHEMDAYHGDGIQHRTGGTAQSHHQTVWAAQIQQQNPMLPLTSAPEWSIPIQQAFRNLPPTPISPFRPIAPLSEDEKAAFPCAGGANDCWNIDLCPKHKQCSKDEAPPSPKVPPTARPTPDCTEARVMPTNPRRRSAPALDVQPRAAKLQRNATEPGGHDTGASGHMSIGRDSRPSISRSRVPHNLVERRYRDNLNNQIELLRLTLPSLKEAQPCLDGLEDTTGPRMPSKAVIISTAATYIKDMENERVRLLAANKALQEQVLGLQKLLRMSSCDDGGALQYLGGMHLSGVANMPTPS